jgi:uncharacterized membrane protein YdjX (TVP38/TMEM64 family)
VTVHRRLVLLGAALAVAAAVVALALGGSPGAIREAAASTGPAAPAAFIALGALITCAFFPIPITCGAAGALFGTVGGTPVAVATGTLAASLAFLISRHAGGEAARELGGARIATWREWIEARGFLSVIYVRILPLVPFTLVNYAAGLTRLRVALFALATAIGIAPRAFAWAALGGSIDDLSSPEAVAAVVLLVVIGAAGTGGALIARRRSRRAGHPEQVPPAEWLE